MPDLHLNLKVEYYEDIKAGTKLYEFRLWSKWQRKLEGKDFQRVFVKKGYPKRGDMARIIERPWRGYELQTITHPLFGPEPVLVAAIRVN